MKTRILLTAAVSLLSMSSAMAQSSASYFVKTNNVKQSNVASGETDAAATDKKAEEELDFMQRNFRYLSLCDWHKGMKFMVLPEKYDLIVGTFVDSVTGKEVSNGRLRSNIMVYEGHSEDKNGYALMNFKNWSDGKSYYYRIPNGTFADYCYNKLGVPTLAYLDDVDKARELLLDTILYTKTTHFRIDSQVGDEGYEEIEVPLNEEVRVTKIGVGTRKFPVKIVVQDKSGREFYQNVTLSRTNCGMRDDEFIMDNTKFKFEGSFELIDENQLKTKEYLSYVGKKVYTRRKTTMEGTDGRIVNVNRFSSFEIMKVRVLNNDLVLMTFKGESTNNLYTKKVRFTNRTVLTDMAGEQEPYFPNLFVVNTSEIDKISPEKRRLMQQGKVAKGFTVDEVKLVLGDPARVSEKGDQVVYTYTKFVVRFRNGVAYDVIARG